MVGSCLIDSIVSDRLTDNPSGFDNAVMSSVNSMKQFHTYFGIGAASGTSLVFGIYNVGSVLGFFPVVGLTDRLGRRWIMFIGATILM